MLYEYKSCETVFVDVAVETVCPGFGSTIIGLSIGLRSNTEIPLLFTKISTSDMDWYLSTAIISPSEVVDFSNSKSA